MYLRGVTEDLTAARLTGARTSSDSGSRDPLGEPEEQGQMPDSLCGVNVTERAEPDGAEQLHSHITLQIYSKLPVCGLHQEISQLD